jgi:16S rRNA G966 N2-methylase RsmD
MDYSKELSVLKEEDVVFDVIFLDPPYQTNYIEKSIQLIDEYNLIKKDKIIVCESDKLDRIIYPNNYEVLKEKKYGDKFVVILKKM